MPGLFEPFRAYGELLALRRVRRPTLAVALASIPIGALSLAVLLLVERTGYDTAVTGVVAAALSVGTGLGILLQGRLMDRFGLTVVLLAAAAFQAVALAALVVLAERRAADVLLVASAFAAGFGEPQVGGALRALWPSLASRRLHPVANAWSSVLLQTTILAGPVLLAAVLPVAGAAGAVLLCGLLFFVGALLLATGLAARLLGVRRLRPRRPASAGLSGLSGLSGSSGLSGLSGLSWLSGLSGTAVFGALADSAVRRLALFAAFLGAVSGLLQFAAFADGQERGDTAATPLLYAALSAGSIVGSFVGGAPSAVPGPARLPRLFGLLLAVVIGASFASQLSVFALGLCLVAVGYALGMLTVTCYVAVGRVAGPGIAVSAYTSLTAAGLVSSGAASSVAGLLATWGGAFVVLLAAAVVTLAGLLLSAVSVSPRHGLAVMPSVPGGARRRSLSSGADRSEEGCLPKRH